uniref:Outer membrane protein transport protein (OMPP1/FadL/TodX family) n=1 Tax=Hydrogenovibrio crunogenus (strain DSM 25203 / XCL-2) TaxID=317025 RepID=Q31IH8_HYDCU
MKKTRIALAIATAAMVSTPVLATNGTNMIGLGAQSNAMGGTGVAASYGAETVIANPAMIGKTTGTEMTFGGTLFQPSVETTNNIKNSAVAAANGITSAQAAAAGAPIGSATSDADTNVIPAVSLSSRINDKLTFGIGMFGTSGMGVDYQDEDMLFNAQTNMQIMKFAPTLAFNSSKFGIGVSPILQYGSLDINYQTQMTNNSGAPMYVQGGGNINSTPSATPAMKTVGHGMASDLGMGYNIGGYFNITNDLTVAASYLSPINMKYKGQLSTASGAFVNPASDFTTPFSDNLEQPSEIKVGAEYIMGRFSVNADYKKVAWGSAKGYKDFGWEDQDVYSLGAKFATNNYWLGAGYNYGSNPIKEQDGTSYKGAVINMFNNTFFPAITESHFTFGGGYSITKHTTLEGSVVYAPEVENSVDTTAVSSAFASGMAGTPTAAASTSTTKHSQIGYTVQVKYNF